MRYLIAVVSLRHEIQLTPVDDAFVLKSFGPGTKLRGWHLQVIGILPEYQRRGIATRIIDNVRAKVRTPNHLLCILLDTNPRPPKPTCR